MDAAAFLRALGCTLAANDGDVPAIVQSAPWTLFMKKCLVQLATDNGLHLCAHGLGRVMSGRAKADQHQSREYLFDFTLYDVWKSYSLPRIIVEHENSWSPTAFLQDFWKILSGWAPLRVMFGYSKRLAGVDKLVEAVMHHERDSGWRYPDGVEDLVLLRCPEAGGMPWPMWRVLYRQSGCGWLDLGAHVLADFDLNRASRDVRGRTDAGSRRGKGRAGVAAASSVPSVTPRRLLP